MSQKISLWAAAPLLLLALLGFTESSSSPQLGTYSVTITAEEIPSSIPAEARGNIAGQWGMTFAAENQYRISKDGNVLVEGRFASTKEQLTLTDEKGPLACSPQSGLETGTYKWSYEEKKLTLTAVEDGCEGRRFILTLHPWRKEK